MTYTNKHGITAEIVKSSVRNEYHVTVKNEVLRFHAGTNTTKDIKKYLEYVK